MPSAPIGAADVKAGGHRQVFYGWSIVAAFAATQTVGYGTLYYAFAVVLHPIAADLHTSTTAVTGALTAAILTWAATAVPVGRWLDRHGGRSVMTTGSVLGSGLLVAWSQVQAVWQLYAVFVGLGITMAMALYEPATAVIVSWFDASIAGTLATPVTLAKAGAPLGAAALFTTVGGYPPVLAVIGAASFVVTSARWEGLLLTGRPVR